MIEYGEGVGKTDQDQPWFLPTFSLSEKEGQLARKYGFVPQFKTLKEWEARRPHTLRVINEATAGLAGYENMPHFRDKEDVARAISEGKLVLLPELGLICPDIEFEELVEPSLRSCVPELAALLELLDAKLQARLGVLPKGEYVAVISATRTVEIQRLLIKLGYHAAPVSTHTLGVAVDLSSKFLGLEATWEAWQILGESRDRGEIILVREIEEPYKVAHISLPSSKHRLYGGSRGN